MTSFLHHTENVFEAIHFNMPMVAECYGEKIKFFCYHDRATDWPAVIKWHQARHPRPVYCFMDVREISHPVHFDVNNKHSHISWIPSMWASLGVDPRRMLWIGNHHSMMTHNQLTKSIGFNIHTEWIRYFEADSHFKHYIQKSYINRQGPNHMTCRDLMSFDKKYLALFGKPRKFMRAGAMIMMEKYNMSKDALISSLVEKTGIDEAVKWASSHWNGHQLKTVLEKHAGPIDKISYDAPYTCDSNYRGYPYDVDLYKKTAVSIVAETNDIDSIDQTTGQFWVTEKICRTMYNHHPFVVLSTPYFLKNLRKLGYQTFNSIIDESYDEETDHYKRLSSALLSAQQLSQNITSTLIRDIVSHNFQMLQKVYDQTVNQLNNALNHISSIK